MGFVIHWIHDYLAAEGCVRGQAYANLSRDLVGEIGGDELRISTGSRRLWELQADEVEIFAVVM